MYVIFLRFEIPQGCRVCFVAREGEYDVIWVRTLYYDTDESQAAWNNEKLTNRWTKASYRYDLRLGGYFVSSTETTYPNSAIGPSYYPRHHFWYKRNIAYALSVEGIPRISVASSRSSYIVRWMYRTLTTDIQQMSASRNILSWVSFPPRVFLDSIVSPPQGTIEFYDLVIDQHGMLSFPDCQDTWIE